MERLEGQAAVITGAAKGIGRGIAEVLASEGCGVALADIDTDGAEAAAAALRARGLEALALSVDVRDPRSTAAMAAAVLERFGRIDILCANAGIYPLVRIEDLDDAQWDRVMDINVKGALHAIRACLPAMLAQRYGRIVLSSSITGPVTTSPGFAAYGASKSALLGMMKAIALETALSGVTINAVLPGNVLTEGLEATGEEHKRQMLASIPMRSFADPADVGWSVRFLASREARYITGQTLIVDGGQVLPESPASLIG